VGALMMERGRVAVFVVLALLAYVFVLSHGSVVSAKPETLESLASATNGDSPDPQTGSLLFKDAFGRSDGLITNEYAYWADGARDAVVSPTWRVTSGSFFVHSGTGWTGIPDAVRPNAASSNGTDSAVFRLTTRRSDFANVAVTFRLRNNALVTTPRTPSRAWDGIHIFLRYRSPREMYYASIDRRDQRGIVKKKCPEGSVNGGTYFTLGSYVQHTFPLGRWRLIRATIETESAGSVVIALYEGSRRILTTRDTGIGCVAIGSGAVGLRGDNDNFQIDDFSVKAL
jgi:hypothetical protein